MNKIHNDFKKVAKISFNQKSATTGCPMLNPKNWMGHIVNKCTASLIAPRWALTARHCELSKGDQINFGYKLLNHQFANCTTGINFISEEKNRIRKVHEIFEREYDIVLIELEASMENLEYLKLHHCNLTLKSDNDNLTLYSIGSPYNFPVSLALQAYKYSDCDLVSFREANYYVRSDKGVVKGTICSGDSGSAIVGVYNNEMVQIGIMSHLCGENEFIGFGARKCYKKASSKARIQLITNNMVTKIHEIIEANGDEKPLSVSI